MSDRDMAYEKKRFAPSNSMPQGSLKQLFSHGAMSASPESSYAANEKIARKDSKSMSTPH